MLPAKPRSLLTKGVFICKLSDSIRLSGTFSQGQGEAIVEVPKRPKPFSMLDKVLDWINVFSLLSVAVLMFVQVILRYVLKMPLMGIEELCYFPTVWLYLFAAVKASSERGQRPRNFLQAATLDLSAPGHRGVRFKRHPAVAHMVGLRLPEVRAQAPEGNGLPLSSLDLR